MRKFLAAALAVLMLCSLVLVVSAERPNEETQALKFTTAPKLDGVITEAEWGKPNAHVTSDYKTAFFCDKDGADEKSEFDLWIRWDENYYYVGIVAPDKTHALAASESNLWNGDAIQMGFDPNGPNSNDDVMSPFTVDDDMGYSNVGFGLVTGEGNTLSSWAFHGPAKGGNGDGAQVEGAKYNIKRDNAKTTYEIAIPWKTMAVKSVKAGDLYGATIVRVLSDDEDEGYNGWLTWGTGVCGPQDEDMACGSNAVRLSATPVTGTATTPDKTTTTPDKTTTTPDKTTTTTDKTTTTPTAPKTADAGIIATLITMAVSAGAALSIKKRK